IVLVADRKVIYANGNVMSRKKIFKDYHPYVVAASGDTTSFDNFRYVALLLAQRSSGRFNERAEFNPILFDSSVFSGVTQVNTTPTAYPIINQPKYLEGLQ